MIKRLILLIGLIFFLAGYSQAGELVGCWSFDEGKGDITIDASNNNNNGKITGAKWVEEEGMKTKGFALEFDGNDYVDCGNNKSLTITDKITIEAWVKGSENGKIVQKARAWYAQGDYHLDKSHFTFYVDDLGHPDGLKSLSFETPDDRWVHIVATYDGDWMKVYINGKIAAEKQIGSHTIDATGGKLGIGADIRSEAIGSNGFKGIIDEVKIYNYALTPEEIAPRRKESLHY